MRTVRTLWRHFCDVRPGEYGRTIAMFFYLLCVLFAYYILKPVSRALFCPSQSSAGESDES